MRVVAVVILGLLSAAVAIALTVEPAWPHDAPTGWTYDYNCCSTKDCHQLPLGTVRLSNNGYQVSLTPEQHHQLIRSTTFTIGYADAKIRPSKDEFYHACITTQTQLQDGKLSGGLLICLYVPPMGF